MILYPSGHFHLCHVWPWLVEKKLAVTSWNVFYYQKSMPPKCLPPTPIPGLEALREPGLSLRGVWKEETVWHLTKRTKMLVRPRGSFLLQASCLPASPRTYGQTDTHTHSLTHSFPSTLKTLLIEARALESVQTDSWLAVSPGEVPEPLLFCHLICNTGW